MMMTTTEETLKGYVSLTVLVLSDKLLQYSLNYELP